MITTKDLCDIIGNKIASDIGKSLIRNSFPPHIAEQLCDAIERNDSAEKFNRIITVENGVKTGGLGSAVIEWMNDHGYHPEIIRLGLPDTEFVEHGTVAELQHIVGLDKEAIIKAIKGI